MIKRLLKCVREYKRASLLAPAFVTGEVILEVIIPIIMAALIDNGLGSDEANMSYIIKMGIVLVVVCMLSLGCGTLSGKYAAKASAGFAKNMRHDMFYNIQTYSFKNIDKFSTSSLVTRLTTDVTNVQNAYMMVIRTAVRGPVMLILSVIATALISPKLSLIFLVAIPILGVTIFTLALKVHPIFEKVFKGYDKLNNVVGENLHGIRVVKSFVREEHEKEKFGNVSTEVYKLQSKAEKLLAFNQPVMMLCVYGCMIALSWFGANMIVNSGAADLTTGQLTSMFSYTMQILMSLMMLSMIFVMVIMSRASIKRIVEVLEETPDIKDPENPDYNITDGSIEFKNVSFSYAGKGGTNCISDINLKINAGETIGIIGGTGSAKSTFVQLIPRLYDVTEGEILVGGKDVREYDIPALRGEVAMVLQKNVLFSGTIKDNLRWGKEDATDEEIEKACRLSQADEFISTFPDGYDTYIEQGGTNVSGGQKQRLCIARALIKKPKILILDDSTSAVDTKTDALIRKAFAEEIPDTTKLIIAQRISSVMNSDKIIVLDGGRINDFGTHEELLARNEIYQEVYYSQQKGGLE
ncbi:MAG: ABC transporter ATP-binding protein/permease [Ruminococcus sp.]|nr:ABC transporter ATP-binding protein/permease [Ruminococcus sp.]